MRAREHCSEMGPAKAARALISMCWGLHCRVMKRLNTDHIENWSAWHHALQLCDALKHKFIPQVLSEIELMFTLWTGPWHKRRHYCIHCKPHLPQRKECFDHKSKFSVMKGWRSRGRIQLAAYKKCKLT